MDKPDRCNTHQRDAQVCIDLAPRWGGFYSCEFVSERLAYLLGEIEAERISYGEVAELNAYGDEGLIPDHEMVLREWGGVPEFGRRKPAKALERGDIVDLEGDEYATGPHDGPDQFAYEYAIVEKVTHEGATTVAVEFVHQGGEIVIGFPSDHLIVVT